MSKKQEKRYLKKTIKNLKQKQEESKVMFSKFYKGRRSIDFVKSIQPIVEDTGISGDSLFLFISIWQRKLVLDNNFTKKNAKAAFDNFFGMFLDSPLYERGNALFDAMYRFFIKGV